MDENEPDHPQIDRNVHPPIVAFLFIAVSYLLGWLIHIPGDASISLRIIGFASICAGFLFGVIAIFEFKKAHTTLDPHGSVKRLVTSGIYRSSRNPIYLGYLLMVIGFPLYSGVYWGILMALFFTATMNRLIIEKEEAYLEGKFQEQYAVYKSCVRRWL